MISKGGAGLAAEAIGFREKDERGLLRWVLTVAASPSPGWRCELEDERRGLRRAQHVLRILFAFFVAVLNWILDKLTDTLPVRNGQQTRS